MSGRRRRHRYRAFNQFKIGKPIAMRWCIDCLSVRQVATYERRPVEDESAWVEIDGVRKRFTEPVPGSFRVIETETPSGADPEWCSAKKWERRRAHGHLRRMAR